MKGNDCNFTILSPEEVDNIVSNRLENLARKGGTLKVWPKDEILLRNNVILEYLLDNGLSRRRCAEQIADRWKIKMSTAYKWIKEAYASLTAIAEGEMEEKKRTQMERLEYLLADARESRNGDLALKVLAEIAKLQGLNVDNKNITFNGDDKIKINFD